MHFENIASQEAERWRVFPFSRTTWLMLVATVNCAIIVSDYRREFSTAAELAGPEGRVAFAPFG